LSFLLETTNDFRQRRPSAMASAPPPDAAFGGGGAAPRPRLMILKMEVENFKSYGGVKEIGPFHKSFSSVVGPNGSGKSNVIDAMLFVFGKKSAKLRMSKAGAREREREQARSHAVRACGRSVLAPRRFALCAAGRF